MHRCRIGTWASYVGYARGLLTLNGTRKRSYAVDDNGSYEMLNVYLGLRDADGVWDVSLYGKNITKTEEVLTRSSTILTTPYNIGAAGQTGVTNYYGGSTSGLGFTAPREFGITVHYAFGSR